MVDQLSELGTQPERCVKLARSAMRTFVAKLLKDQGGNCPLCGLPIDLKIKGEGVLDHDHDSGRIRGVLHRSCNAAEGKVANAAGRWGAKSTAYKDIVPWLENLVAYLKTPQQRFIYPYHQTEDEKRLDRNKKAREANARRRAKVALARNNKGTE